MSNSIVAFVVVLGILVFFHELGHFLVARFFNVGVETFSLGFGPKIYKRRMGFTEYCISMIPLGGYVKMIGEEPGDIRALSDLEHSFSHKKIYQRMLIVAAGPFFNFLLALIIFYGIFQFTGVYYISPIVGEVTQNTPAAKAGIKPGDIIEMIDGNIIKSWDDMVKVIGDSGGRPAVIGINRSGASLTVRVMPEPKTAKNIFGEDVQRYMIGISSSGDVLHEKLNPFQALGQGIKRTWDISKLTILSVVKIIKGSVSADNLGGPIMIAQMAGEQAKAGAANLAFFIAMLSINLGIINLFPVPVLDGGHLVFFSIEAVTGKVASENVREKANQFGIALLVALMVFVFYNDLIRIFNGA